MRSETAPLLSSRQSCPTTLKVRHGLVQNRVGFDGPRPCRFQPVIPRGRGEGGGRDRGQKVVALISIVNNFVDTQPIATKIDDFS